MSATQSISLAVGLTIATAGSAFAADLTTMPVKAKPVPDLPFFFVNDNRLTYAYQFTATAPSAADKTAKQVLAFTHFDVWAYGTNFINLRSAEIRQPGPSIAMSSDRRGAECLRGRDGILRPGSQHLRLEPDLQHQGHSRSAR